MSKPQGIPRNWLVGEWVLDSTAIDTSWNGYNGTPSNVIYSNTDVGYNYTAATFNGTSSNILITGSSAWDYSSLTVSAMVYVTSTPTGSRVIVSKGSNGSNEPWTVGFDGSWNCILYTQGMSTTVNLWVLPNGVWSHVTFAWTFWSTGKWYLNGQLVSTQSVPAKTTTTTNAYIWAFNVSAALSRYFTGQMEAVRVYSRELQPQEITALYYESKKLLSGKSYNDLMSGLVAYYDFQGDANEVISGNNGTVSGATLTTDRFGIANSAYSFNGSTNYILATNATVNQLLSSRNPYTIFGSFKLNGLSGQSPNLIDIRQTNYNGVFFEVDLATGNLNYTRSDGSVADTIARFPSLTTGVTYNFAVSYDWTNGRISVNGSSGTSPTTSTRTLTAETELNIGSGWAGSTRFGYLNGSIDFIGIKNGALSQDELNQLTRLEAIEDPQPYYRNLPKCLQSWLLFMNTGDISGTTDINFLGDGNNATWNAAPTTWRVVQWKSLTVNWSTNYATLNYSATPGSHCLFAMVRTTVNPGVGSNFNQVARTEWTFGVSEINWSHGSNAAFVGSAAIRNSAWTYVTAQAPSWILLANRWALMACDFDGSFVRLYVNWVEVAKSAWSGTMNSVTKIVFMPSFGGTSWRCAYHGYYTRSLSAYEHYMLSKSLFVK